MASVETELYFLLTNDAGVTAIISTRIYPNIALQGAALPHLVYKQLSGPRDEVMEGPSGLVESRFEMNCWSDTYSETRDLADAVRALLDGYSGTADAVEIQAIHLVDESDTPALTPGTDVIKRYGKRLDLTVWFKE